MSSSIESLLAAVQGKELQNRRASLAILIFTIIASLVTIGILHSWYPWWCAFSALVLLGAFALYLIRAGVRPCTVSPEEAAILVDAALPTKERFSALLSLRSSLDPIDTARSVFISQQLSEILAEGTHPAQIAPFKLSGSERCALITALLLTLSAILLFVFRPQPKLLALAVKIESILAADPTIPEPLRAQALALAEAIKDTPLGSSQINMELNGARKELEQALAESERGKSLGERTVQGSKEAREYPQEPKQKQAQATPIPVPPTPGPHEQKKQEPQEEKQQGKEQRKPGAQEQKEEEQKKKEQGKEEQSANEQSGSGQGAEKEESGDNPSQQGSEQQEQAGEQKQQGGSDQGESAADKDPSAKEQGGQQGDGDGQGSGKGAGEGEGKGKGGEGKGVGSGDGKGQGSGESSDSDSSSANSGSAEASGATGKQGQEKQDREKQGSAGQQGAQGGSSPSGSQSSSLQQLEAALNEVEQGVKQQGQGQEGTGAEKGPQSKPQSPSQSGSQAGAQGTGSKGAGKGAAKEPSKSDPEKSENSNSDSKQAKEGSDSGSSDKAKQKPSEKTENEEQGEQDSNGERSALPDRDAPAQTGGLSDGAGSAGLGSNQGFKEAPIGSLKEAIDERFTDESSNLEKNLEPAQAKTTIEDLPLTKPKGSLQRGEQPIPLEYSDILKGPSPY